MALWDLFATRRDPGAALAAGMIAEPKASFGPTSSLGGSDGWFWRNIGGEKTDAGANVNQWNATTLPSVYSSVSIIADAFAALPGGVFKKREDGRGADPVPGHPVAQLLALEPNEDMSAFSYRQTMMHHVLLWGNGYSEVERTYGGDPKAFLLLFPDRTNPRKPAGERLRYESTVDGRRITLPPEDVLHIPALGFDGILGYSPVAVAREAMGMGLAMQRFGGKFFANDAKSGGFLMHPGKLGDIGTKNVSDSFMKQGGPDNAFKVKVLEEGMKFIQTTIPPDDAQFLASREFQVAEIARIFRVPLVLLQAMEKSTSWGSGIEQMMIGFVVWTIQPWVVKWEQELTRKLLTPKERAEGYYVKFNLNALMRGDMKARADFYERLRKMRAMSANEVRALEEMNPYPGGDVYDDMSTTTPAEPASAESADDRAATERALEDA
jgi:HK97 family phage portal protein